jgi:hypothetical protein
VSNYAKYGDPKWTWLYYFSSKTYLSGSATLIETDAQFQNEFGEMAHVRVVCDYDLNRKTVLNVSLDQIGGTEEWAGAWACLRCLAGKLEGDATANPDRSRPHQLISGPLIDFGNHLAVHLELRHGVLPLIDQVRSLDPAVGMPTSHSVRLVLRR